MRPRIANLADHPGLLPVLAQWHHGQFHYLDPQSSPEKHVAMLRDTLTPGDIATTFVALEDDTLLGSASLIHRDMHTRMDLTPWLAAVFVAPEFRQRGIGSALVRRIVAEAKQLGVKRLYLYTPDKEGFYSRLGWSVLEKTVYRGHRVVVMWIDTAE